MLSTFGDLDPLLVAEKDRYSVEGTHDDTSFDYRLTFTGKARLFYSLDYVT